MTNDPLYNELRESSWQRKLTAAEEEALRHWLAGHPEAQADWEMETALSQALGRLPDASVPSNFTARVMQAVEREEVAASRQKQGGSFWARLRWLPRIAVAAVVLGTGLISYERIQANQTREQIRAVKIVAEVSSLPDPAVLKDFDTIQALNQTPSADEELLQALK